MTLLTIELHDVTAGDLPDADTDVLIWDASDPEAQLGAYVGDGWVNAQGEAVEGVHTWAHMPCLPVRAESPPNRCKLTECRGRPRCRTCTAMDRSYGLQSPEKALRALIAECEFANEQCVQRFKHTVIDLGLLDEARAALGERTATFCGGWPTLRTPAWQPPEKLVFDDNEPPNVGAKRPSTDGSN